MGSKLKFQKTEKVALGGLGSLLLLRMLALFMLYPVFSLYANEYRLGESQILVGLALGAYAFSQGCMQLPFGMLSDRFGRQPLLVFGLALLALGGVIAGTASSMVGVIVGRALQGAGAIGSVVHATVADATREAIRPRAMAVLGSIVGMAFFISMLLGPILHHYFALRGMFLLSAVLAVLGIVVTLKLVPKVNVAAIVANKGYTNLFYMELLSNYVTMFIAHMAFVMLFLVLPQILQNLGFNSLNLWQFYSPVLTFAFTIVFALILAKEKNLKQLNLVAIARYLLMTGLAILIVFKTSFVCCAIAMLLFFTGFSLLEAFLPALVAKLRPQQKGSALGMLATFQFVGVFSGGMLGGVLLQKFSINFMLSVVLSCVTIVSVTFALIPPSLPED